MLIIPVMADGPIEDCTINSIRDVEYPDESRLAFKIPNNVKALNATLIEYEKKADIILPVFSGDVIEKNYLTRVAAVFSENPGRVGCVYGDYFTKGGMRVYQEPFSRVRLVYGGMRPILPAYSKDLLLLVGLFDERLSDTYDYDMLIRISEKSALVQLTESNNVLVERPPITKEVMRLVFNKTLERTNAQ